MAYKVPPFIPSLIEDPFVHLFSLEELVNGMKKTEYDPFAFKPNYLVMGPEMHQRFIEWEKN